MKGPWYLKVHNNRNILVGNTRIKYVIRKNNLDTYLLGQTKVLLQPNVLILKSAEFSLPRGPTIIIYGVLVGR